MTQKNNYEQLSEMFVTVGAPDTPALRKVVCLQFTPLEARLAVQIGFTGDKLDELSQKLGIERERLQKTLKTMAEKGTMWIDPGKEDPNYRLVAVAAGGISETGLWTNVKFPFTVELGVALNEFIDDWSKNLSKMGFPYLPVWAAESTLPEDALPSENLVEFIKDKGHWSISPCPCRLSRWLSTPGEHCQHMLETCLHFGDMSRWTSEHGMSRAITYEEAVDILRKGNEDGLIHTLAMECVCMCCTDCCIVSREKTSHISNYKPSPFRALCAEDLCDACGICAERCPVSAIEVDEVAYVNQEICVGCGVCITACKQSSLHLVRLVKAEEAPTAVPAEARE